MVVNRIEWTLQKIDCYVCNKLSIRLHSTNYELWITLIDIEIYIYRWWELVFPAGDFIRTAKVINCAAAPMCVIIISIVFIFMRGAQHFGTIFKLYKECVCVYQHLHYCYFLLKKFQFIQWTVISMCVYLHTPYGKVRKVRWGKQYEIILYNLLWSDNRDAGVYILNNGFVAIIQLEIWQ